MTVPMMVLTKAKIDGDDQQRQHELQRFAGRERDDTDLERGDQGDHPDRESIDDDADEEAHSAPSLARARGGGEELPVVRVVADPGSRASANPGAYEPGRPRRPVDALPPRHMRRHRLGRVTEASDIPIRVRPEIAALPPYKQGKQAGGDAFKLSSNENPFDPLPGVLDAVQAATALNRYPDASAARLQQRLADRFGVGADSIHIGAGSVSILAQLVLATSGPGDEVIYAWRSFEAYPWLAVVAGATAVQVPLTAEARHDFAAMTAAITDRTRAIIVCSPNNPTGPIVTQAEFDEFVATRPR